VSSFSALFKAAGSQECEVVTCSYNFNQSTDDKGRPSSVVQGGTVNVTIIATAESKPLISWMLDPYKQDSGSITFKRADQDSMLKDIQFEEAYCVGYTEVFDGRGDSSDASMTLSLTISANKLTVNGAKLDNKWK
jgi:hypothetical protein